MYPRIIVYQEAEKSYIEANRSKCNPAALETMYQEFTSYDNPGKINVCLDTAAEFCDYLTSKGISYIAQKPIMSDTKKSAGNYIVFRRL